VIAPNRASSPLPSGPVLVDTSLWIDHLRGRSGDLAVRLEAGEVVTHPFVIGELACGHLARRREVLALLAALPSAPLATHAEAMRLVESRRLAGLGLSWVDAHLLAAALLLPARLWTGDRALAAAAVRLGVG
jgi:predicted nucleic acid-binding protein